MRSLFFAALVARALCDPIPDKPIKPDDAGRYTLEAEGIKASFIEYGATLTNLWVADKDGVNRDVVLGYDNTSFYPVDPNHPVYNAIPGRYTNRIGNGQFTLDNVTYNLEKNDGPNTLHSGTKNWSFRFWKVIEATTRSITFALHDPANSTGMPGAVDATVTYSLEKNKWRTHIRAISPEVRTIIMLTQHTYFNLDGFSNPDTELIWNHTLHIPKGKTYLHPDPNMLPTGQLDRPPVNDINDFWSRPRQIGFASDRPEFKGNCGTGSGCSGYNNQWILDGAPRNDVAVTLKSDYTGISAELRTNQPGIVIYTCYWMDGSIPIKSTQGLKGKEGQGTVKSSGCVAIEAHDYVDGINHPEWKREKYQVFGPGQVYNWEGTWEFKS